MISNQQVLEMIEKNKNGYGVRTLAKEYGIPRHKIMTEFRKINYQHKVHPVKIEFTSKQVKEFTERYESGESLVEISKTELVSNTTLAKILGEHGLKFRQNNKPFISKSVEKEIVALYKTGVGTREIAGAFSHGVKTIRSVLVKKGIKVRNRFEGISATHRRTNYKRKHSIDESVFDRITEQSAYWIGFLMADGYISKNKSAVHLNLKADDETHIRKFRKFLKSSHKITVRDVLLKHYGISKAACYSFNSFKIVKTLKDFGVTNRKSLTAKAKKIQNNPHFWRGVIDGDGSIFLSKTGNNNLIVALVGSKTIIEQFLQFVNTITKTNASVREIKKSKAFETRISGFIAEKVLQRIYKNPKISLDRKHETVKEVFNIYKIKKHKKNKHKAKIKKVIELYKSGKSVMQIEKIVDFHNVTIYNTLKRNNIKKDGCSK